MAQAWHCTPPGFLCGQDGLCERTGILEQPLRLLVIPSWYPTDNNPATGIYFQEQATAYNDNGLTSSVVYPEFRSLKAFHVPALKERHFQITSNVEEGVYTTRLLGWDIFPMTRMRSHAWCAAVIKLAHRQIIIRGVPDIILAHGAFWAGIAAAHLSKEYHRPFIIQEHFSHFVRDLISPADRAKACHAFERAALVVPVSRSLADALTANGYVHPDKVRIVPNMVDSSFFTMPPRPRAEHPFHFFALALLEPVKGFDVLLRAFERVLKTSPESRLEIGGDGSERQHLELLAHKLGIDSKVKFSGMLNRSQVREAFWRANAFVHASYCETFGVVLIEAMSTGLPVICTDCGAPSEILTAESGMLVPAGNPAELCNAMLCLIQDRNVFIPEKIREVCIKKFDKINVIDQMVRHCQEVINHHPH